MRSYRLFLCKIWCKAADDKWAIIESFCFKSAQFSNTPLKSSHSVGKSAIQYTEASKPIKILNNCSKILICAPEIFIPLNGETHSVWAVSRNISRHVCYRWVYWLKYIFFLTLITKCCNYCMILFLTIVLLSWKQPLELNKYYVALF